MVQAPSPPNRVSPAQPNNKMMVWLIIVGSTVTLVITGVIIVAVLGFVINNAHKSERNNARKADINIIANAANHYLATTNQHPERWTDIAPTVDKALGHYSASASYNQSINLAGSWGSQPTTDGDFPTASDDLAITPDRPAIASTGRLFGDSLEAVDLLLIIRQAACSDEGLIDSSAIRSMAIIYRLEGQDDIICLEV